MIQQVRLPLLAMLIVFLVHDLSHADDQLRRRGKLGIVAKVPADTSTPGVEIARLRPGSPADRSDLKSGDIITHLNGKQIQSLNQFAEVILRLRAGTQHRFTINRAGTTLHINIISEKVQKETSTSQVKVKYTWFRASDGVPLRGLITQPAKQAGPWPTILILPGLGGMPCDDHSFELYTDLAHEFSKHGFAVVRWDQRGTGDSYGLTYKEVDFESEVDDAVAVLNELFHRKQIDRSRIYAFGYSMGGVTGPHVVAKQDGLAGLITWGTISRPLVEHMIEVAREQGQLANLTAPQIDRQVRLTIRFYERLVSGENPLELVKEYPQLRSFISRDGTVQGKTAAYWRQVDSTPYWRFYGQKTVPVLALYGEYDFVASIKDQDNIVALARAGGRRDVHAVIVPGTDHYMNTVQSRKESFDKLKSREYKFNAVAVEATVKWIKKLEAYRQQQPQR